MVVLLTLIARLFSSREFILTSMLMLLCLTLLGAQADDGLTEAAASTTAQPVRVYVGVYLHDVSSLEQKQGTFDVDAEVWAKWRGDFDPDLIRFANAARVERQVLGRESDGTWHSARWRMTGSLRGEFPVQRFPFDEQTLAVILELPEEAGQLVPDLAGSGMAQRFSITDWLYEPEFRPAVSREIFRTDLGSVVAEGQQAILHRVGFEVTIRRPIRPVVLKLFLPLAIVALVVMGSLLIHPDSTQPRVTMSVTGLVACFAFQFSISDVLPEVAYLTLADTLFIVVYLISSCCVAAAIITHYLHRHGHVKQAIWVDRGLRPVLPIAALVLVWSALPEPIPAPVSEPDPIPVMTRHASARDIVRIGTSQRLRVASAAAGVASYWPIIYADPEQGPQVLLVERAPNVDNEALRFLASGEIEVTWRLREGAHWSDGRPIVVEDMKLPLVASPDPQIIDVSTPDDRTLVLRWSTRLARALESPRLWPTHVLTPVFEEGGYDAVRQHLGESALPSIGPFHIVASDEDRIIAEANPSFLAAAPNIRRVEILRYPDSASLTRAFENGDVDLTIPNAVSAEDFERLQQRRPEVAHHGPSSSFVLLHPNLEHPLLRQVEVRQAILQAIDRERIAHELHGAGGRVANVPVAGPVPEGVQIREHDLEAAKEALERVGALGATITLTYDARTSDTLIERLVEDLQAAGLTIELDAVRSSWGPWREGGHAGLLLHTIRADRDVDPRQWWNLPTVDGRYASDARNVAYTQAIQALVEREGRALYPERREQLRDALHASWSERLPGIPLVFSDERLLVDPALRGWHRPSEAPFGHGLEKWYFQQD